MRRLLFVVGLLAVIGAGVGIYFIMPVEGPKRDLTLKPDVEHGAYLISLGGCVACHTDAKANRPMLSGGAALKTPFGTFYAPNITPDKTYGIGEWTLADFSNAISNGHGPGFGNFLYPAFPYDDYTYLSDQDVVDLYAALKETVPAAAVPSTPHEVSFPFNIRLILGGWQHLFFHPERYQPDPTQSEQWNRGRYLAYGPGHCVACHTPRNALGARDDAHAFEGSSGTPGGNVPPITTADLKQTGYDKDTLIETLTSGFTPDFNLLGGEMGAVIEDSTSKWKKEDLEALATYLLDQK